MTTNTADKEKVENQFADLDKEFADEKSDVWAREEQFTIAEIAELATVPMPDNLLEARQIDYKSADFKAAYPAGLPCLMIVLLGISVDFAFSEDHKRRIYIPLYGDRPEQYGKKKGRRSQAHIVSQAFVDVFKARPFGAENRGKIVGRKCVFGQHLGEAVIQGNQQEWAWDVPRTLLADDYKYDGEVRVLQARDRGAAGSSGSSVGTAQVSDEDAVELVLGAIVGLSSKAKSDAADAIMEIPGLPSEWYDAAANGNVLKLANAKGLIVAEDGKVVRAPAEVAEESTEAGEAEDAA